MSTKENSRRSFEAIREKYIKMGYDLPHADKATRDCLVIMSGMQAKLDKAREALRKISECRASSYDEFEREVLIICVEALGALGD